MTIIAFQKKKIIINFGSINKVITRTGDAIEQDDAVYSAFSRKRFTIIKAQSYSQEIKKMHQNIKNV